MNRLILIFIVIVTVTLLITFAPFLLGAAIILWIFRRRKPVATFQKSERPSIDSDVIDVEWKEVRHENS